MLPTVSLKAILPAVMVMLFSVPAVIVTEVGIIVRFELFNVKVPLAEPEDRPKVKERIMLSTGIVFANEIVKSPDSLVIELEPRGITIHTPDVIAAAPFDTNVMDDALLTEEITPIRCHVDAVLAVAAYNISPAAAMLKFVALPPLAGPVTEVDAVEVVIAPENKDSYVFVPEFVIVTDRE